MITGVSNIKREINELKEARIALEKERNLLKATLNSIGEGIITVNNSGKITSMNSAAEALTGWSKEEAIGKKLDDVLNIINEIIGLKIKLPINKLIKSKEVVHFQDDLILISKEGINRNISINASPVIDNHHNLYGVIFAFRDITEIKRTEDELEYLVKHDELTGLYNRAHYNQALKQLKGRSNLPVSFILGNVNGLKVINDVFGSEKGDKLLITIADILKNACRKECIISRLGGDEFSIVLPRTGEREVISICERIRVLCEDYRDEIVKPSIALGYYTRKSDKLSMSKCIKYAGDRMYRNKILQSQSMRSTLFKSLRKSLFERNYETLEHTQRMADLCSKLGNSLGLTASEKDDLCLLALMHDIGKIGIPDNILLKPGKLTEEEYNEMKKHTEVGYRIAKTSKELSHIADYILCHHERWDGKGYPKGLKGDHIPKLSRIISIVDSYDAMTNDRVYKKALRKDDALKEIKRNAGTQFDPEISNEFLKIMSN